MPLLRKLVAVPFIRPRATRFSRPGQLPSIARGASIKRSRSNYAASTRLRMGREHDSILLDAGMAVQLLLE